MVRVGLEALTECLLTVHQAVSGYLVTTLREIEVARKGNGHPTSHANGQG